MNDAAMDQQQVQQTRPRTPVPTLWFEFLLDASLLQKHLAQDNPEPTATQLLVQFVDQSIKTQGEEESEPQKRKAASLKSLALQVAAHLNWNITRLQKNLPLFMVHKVLKDFVESVSPPNLNIQPGTDVCSLGDSVLVALAVYNRWCIRTLLDSTHTSKPIKTTVAVLPNGSNLNVASINEMVIKTVKDTLQESVSFLERCLPINRDISVPGMQTFLEAPPTKVQDAPPPDGPPANGDARGSSPLTDHRPGAPRDPLPVLTKEQFLCLLCYDLGSFYFHQRIVPRAAEMFGRVLLLLPSLSGCAFCDIDASTLQGYLAACGGGHKDWHSLREIPRGHMLQQIEKCRQLGMKGIIELLEEDNRRLETPLSYRDHLVNTVLSSQPSVDSQTAHQVLILHVIRRYKEGLTVPPQLLSVLRRASDDNLEALGKFIQRELQQQEGTDKSKIQTFIRCLCSDERVFKQLQQLLQDAMPGDELPVLCQRVLKEETVAMEIGSSAQTDNMALQLGHLEQRLLLSNSHLELESILTQLHRLGPGKRYSNICSKWQIEKSYAFILDGMGNKKTQDVLFLLLVKAQHCTEIKNYTAAKSLLETAHTLVRDTSFKLQKALLHEILYIELLSGEASSRQVEPGKPTVAQRIQACLASAKSERDITPRDKILDQCIVHLLNSGNWADAMAADFIGTPYSVLGKVIATVCHDLSVRKDALKSSTCLWNATLQIFSSSNKQVKRTSTGKPAATVQRESMLAIMLRSDFLQFLKQLRSSLCLSVMLSSVIRLHNLLKDDTLNELSHEHAQLWPNTVTNSSAISVDSVTMVMGQLISHVISVNPGQPSWLRTQADYHYANSQYASALQFYLQSASVVTGLFEMPVPRDVWSDQVYRRLIKCCNQLQCYTQVALLCQLLQPVDYTTAFKALQEKSCYDAGDALYDCIWDVTILEYLIYLHNKRNEQDKKQKAVQALSATELNSSNPEIILSASAQKRACKFLRAMAKQYL
ncbi:integrator complex subunit 8-like [Acanthaster planci]|uniref:Integrator complex subunit 8-like n=1 Tax=Acanthaster planci TaxID=133434 RepID=A0A8B7YHG4_ACAPL|nr:integrator complex subunit 8-like [Acanthaster planci]